MGLQLKQVQRLGHAALCMQATDCMLLLGFYLLLERCKLDVLMLEF